MYIWYIVCARERQTETESDKQRQSHREIVTKEGREGGREQGRE